MKLLTIMNAVGAFTKLANSDLSLPNAYKLQKLVAALQTEIDFFNEKKQKIYEKFAVDGGIPEDSVPVAQAELDELLSLEVQTEFAPLRLPLTEDIKISASDIGFLSPFIEFTGGDANE